MTPLSSIKSICIICIAFYSLVAIGCDNQAATKCPECRDSLTATACAHFKIIDKTSKESMFFGKQAKFNISQLKIYHVTNGRTDSLAAPLTIDSVKRLFNMNVRYRDSADTLVMQIANLGPDTLYMPIGVTGRCCPRIFISLVTSGGSVIYNTFSGTNTALVKANVITILK